jgi:hypothetical protein
MPTQTTNHTSCILAAPTISHLPTTKAQKRQRPKKLTQTHSLEFDYLPQKKNESAVEISRNGIVTPDADAITTFQTTNSFSVTTQIIYIHIHLQAQVVKACLITDIYPPSRSQKGCSC